MEGMHQICSSAHTLRLTESSNCNSNTILPHAVPPETDRSFDNPYDDFQSDPIPPDPHEALEQPAPEANTSIDRDDAILSFNPPFYNFALLDCSLHQTSISLNARLHGMFFKADSPPTPAPPNLTCYRRNLFQVTGSIRIPRSLRYILMEDGIRIPIVAQELHITATESVEDHPVKLISVPWKTHVNNAPPVPEDKEREPTSIPLDFMSNQDVDADYATFPFAWKRLQFRIATANNGRRKELQQHFVARLRLVATLSNGNKVPIAEAISAAIVVRGRSPRNFQPKKDSVADSDKNTLRKGPTSPAVPARRATTDASRSPLKREHSGENAFASFSYNVNGSPAQAPHTFSNTWPRQTHGSPRTSTLPTPPFKASAPPSSISTISASPPSLPQPLSTTSDLPTSQRPHKLPRTTNRPHPYTHASLPSPRSLLSNSQPQIQNPRNGSNTADVLYGYFPHAVDDWQKPVDAGYRPHVAHHIPMAAGASGGPPGRSQRYYGENVS